MATTTEQCFRPRVAAPLVGSGAGPVALLSCVRHEDTGSQMAYLFVSVAAILASGLTFFFSFGLGTLLLPAFALFVPIDQAIAMTAVDLAYMLANRRTTYKDICLDAAVRGTRTKRPAFDAMIAELKADPSISHLFVHKRDRLGRPRASFSMMLVEEELKSAGVTIVTSEGVIAAGDGLIRWLSRER